MKATMADLIKDFDQKQINRCNLIIEKANAEAGRIQAEIEQLKRQLKDQKAVIKEAGKEIAWRNT